jgi:hypothetical protein
MYVRELTKALDHQDVRDSPAWFEQPLRQQNTPITSSAPVSHQKLNRDRDLDSKPLGTNQVPLHTYVSVDGSKC